MIRTKEEELIQSISSKKENERMQPSGTQQVVRVTSNQVATSIPSRVEYGGRHQRGGVSSFESHHAPCICIFEVDENSKILREKYTPRIVSIGPLHHGKPQFAWMQLVKKKQASNFTKRVGENVVADFRDFLRVNELQIRVSYAWDTSEIPSQKFIDIISCDAMFFIEILLKTSKEEVVTDGLLINRDVRTLMMTELLLLENQIPLFVHLDLWERCMDSTYRRDQRRQTYIVDFLQLFSEYFEVEEYLACGLSNATARAACHLLDLRRLMETGGLKEKRTTTKCLQVKSATALANKHYWVKLIPIFQRNMCSAKFCRACRKLEIPQVHMDRYWESRIVNMMAFETYYYHYMEERPICQSMYLLCSLISKFEDMELLMDRKILIVEDPYPLFVYRELKKIRLKLQIFDRPTHCVRPVICEELDKAMKDIEHRMVQMQKLFPCFSQKR